MAAASLLLAAATLPACTDRASASAPQIHLNTNQPSAVVEVTGVPDSSLQALSRASMSSADWQALLRVSVKASGSGAPDSARPAVAGTYSVADGIIRFSPLFPFDEGREYVVIFDPSRLPGDGATGASAAWRKQAVTAVVGRPAVARSPSTVVSHVYPSSDVLPANQLRMYLHFSAPMDWRSGFEHLQLLDEHGKEVVDAFLPLDADFWNDDRTRYTVFFDPGRVKRGILPNKQMGRALEAGKRYTLVVKREWRDGHGLPLKEEFRREFRATAAIERPLTMSAWRVTPPAPHTREPLAVTFPEPLDHGLLRRALGVTKMGNDGKALDGEVAIEGGETRWLFTPREPWARGDYQLVALSFLEDLAGNRIGRAFEVDRFDRTDSTPEPERATLSFRVASQSATR